MYSNTGHSDRSSVKDFFCFERTLHVIDDTRDVTETNICFRLFKMAPNLFGTSATLYLEASQQNIHQKKSTAEKTNNQELLVEKSSNTESNYEWKIVWRNVIAFIYLHIGAIYGLYLTFTSVKFQTNIWRKYKLFDETFMKFRKKIEKKRWLFLNLTFSLNTVSL